jgi:hypothetical protein
MFDIALMVKIPFFGTDKHCLSCDGTTASDKMTCGTQKVRITLCTEITVTRGVHTEQAVYRIHTMNPAVPTSDTTRHTSPLCNHCTWSAENAKQGNHYAGCTVPPQTRIYYFRAILSASSKPHSDNQLPHTRYSCSSGTSSNQLITINFADEAAVL